MRTGKTTNVDYKTPCVISVIVGAVCTVCGSNRRSCRQLCLTLINMHAIFFFFDEWIQFLGSNAALALMGFEL